MRPHWELYGSPGCGVLTPDSTARSCWSIASFCDVTPEDCKPKSRIRSHRRPTWLIQVYRVQVHPAIFFASKGVFLVGCGKYILQHRDIRLRLTAVYSRNETPDKVHLNSLVRFSVSSSDYQAIVRVSQTCYTPINISKYLWPCAHLVTKNDIINYQSVVRTERDTYISENITNITCFSRHPLICPVCYNNDFRGWSCQYLHFTWMQPRFHKKWLFFTDAYRQNLDFWLAMALSLKHSYWRFRYHIN